MAEITTWRAFEGACILSSSHSETWGPLTGLEYNVTKYARNRDESIVNYVSMLIK